MRSQQSLPRIHLKQLIQLLFSQSLFGRDWENYEDLIIQDNDLEEIVYRKTLHAYVTLFKQFYGIELPLDHNILLSIKDPSTGLDKHYKVEINHKFTQIKVLSEPKELTDEQLQNLVQNAHDLNLWMEYLPPQNFEFQGATMFKLLDVTVPESISQLKYDLLDKESLMVSHKFDRLQHKLRSIFKIADLRLGVVAFDKESGILTKFGKVSHSMMLGCDTTEGVCSNALGLHEKLVQKGESLIINDMNELAEENPFWKNVMNIGGVQSLLLAPLDYDGELIGVMELGASQPGQLSSSYLIQIKDIIPLFSMALSRNAEERTNNVEAIIKKQYTAIHPSVEWRFEQAARRYLGKKERGETAEVEQIAFKEVYPLYAATDIRNSSTERNRAIQADLIEHLELARSIIQKGIEKNPLPILQSVHFKIQKHIKSIAEGLFSGDEMGIIEFLQTEIEPCFAHMEELMPEVVQELIEDYHERVDAS